MNYKNNLLISIIEELLPNGELGWQAVAAEYQKASKEDCERDSTDVKKHWIKNLCNGMKKPTGSTGENNDRVHRCIAIEKLILDKTNSGLLGLSSDKGVHRSLIFFQSRVKKKKKCSTSLTALTPVKLSRLLPPPLQNGDAPSPPLLQAFPPPFRVGINRSLNVSACRLPWGVRSRWLIFLFRAPRYITSCKDVFFRFFRLDKPNLPCTPPIL